MLACLLLFSVVPVFAGCSSDQNEVPVLHTDLDYENLNTEVKQLTLSAFQKPEDHSLTPAEEQNLKKARVKVQGLIAYKPELYSNYFIAAKAAYLVGDYTTAIQYVQQCVGIGFPSGTSPTFYEQTVAEAKYIESRSWFNLHEYQRAADAAAIAARIEPKSVLYRMAEARAEFQMGHDTTTTGILKEVLKLDPRNTEAQKLMDLLKRNPAKL